MTRRKASCRKVSRRKTSQRSARHRRWRRLSGGAAGAEILARVIQIISGPADLASFLRRNRLGKPLADASLPLDVGPP